MKKYSDMTKGELAGLKERLLEEYESIKASGLNLNMARGVPHRSQIDLSRGLFDVVGGDTPTVSEEGCETASYGLLSGIIEAKRLMAPFMQVEVDEVFVGGTSSLNLMYDVATFCLMHALPGDASNKPWIRQEGVKFICPVPGYDRHFTITENLGVDMVMVPMTKEGPDMDAVEALAGDKTVKGMWCVPKYSNPQGITYSDETVKRLAAMKPAAGDFRIFWDNAYAVHDLYGNNKDELLPILPELKKHGNENNVFIFASTAKVTFPGGGISSVGASRANLDFITKQMSAQAICFDKINQLRHARFFKDQDAVAKHMEKHAEIIRPKFEAVLDTLEAELGGLGVASWEKPAGGYFISLDTLPGLAGRVVGLCKDAGLVMTPAGATHPYGKDPDDKTIRIAPTFPDTGELLKAGRLFCVCVKLAGAEKLLGQ